MKYLNVNDSVWYVNTSCADDPVRPATVEYVNGDCVNLWDEYLGDVNADPDDVFETEDEAQAALQSIIHKEAIAKMEMAMAMMKTALDMLKNN